jgi:hypothetical protein
LDPYIVGHYRLEVANDVFNGVGTSGLVILPRHIWSIAQRHVVRSPCTVIVPIKWLAVLALYYSRLFARLAGIVYGACPHVLQARNGPNIRRLGNVHA